MAKYDSEGKVTEFEVGDVVRLKSGGPDMTVVTIGALRLLGFLWFNDASEWCGVANIHESAVLLVTDTNYAELEDD